MAEKEFTVTGSDGEIYTYKPPFERAWEIEYPDGEKFYEHTELVEDEFSPSGYSWNYTAYEDVYQHVHVANYGYRYDEYDGLSLWGYKTAEELIEDVGFFDDDRREILIEQFEEATALSDSIEDYVFIAGTALFKYTSNDRYNPETDQQALKAGNELLETFKQIDDPLEQTAFLQSLIDRTNEQKLPVSCKFSIVMKNRCPASDLQVDMKKHSKSDALKDKVPSDLPKSILANESAKQKQSR